MVTKKRSLIGDTDEQPLPPCLRWKQTNWQNKLTRPDGVHGTALGLSAKRLYAAAVRCDIAHPHSPATTRPHPLPQSPLDCSGLENDVAHRARQANLAPVRPRNQYTACGGLRCVPVRVCVCVEHGVKWRCVVVRENTNQFGWFNARP